MGSKPTDPKHRKQLENTQRLVAAGFAMGASDPTDFGEVMDSMIGTPAKAAAVKTAPKR